MASSIDDGEVSDSESEKQTKYKKRRMQEDSPNIGEEEEARLRAVLLARQAEKRERSEKSSSSKKLDRQHRVHKKKKKRREDETLPDAAPRERQKIVFESSSKFSAKVSVIEKSTIEPNKDDDTEIGLNIQPPQQIPTTVASSSATDYAHRRKHRKREKRKSDDFSIEQHRQKSISKERKDDRGIEDKYVRGEHEVDKREKRIQEGWASWKQSLQSTGGAGGISRSTSSRSTSGADLKGYQQIDRDRRPERERPVEKSSSRRRDDQQQLPKGREEHYWNRESRSHKDDRNRRSPYRSAGEERHSKRHQEAAGWLPQMSRRREVVEISDRNQTSSSSKFVEKSKIIEGRNFKYNRKEQTQTTVVRCKGAGEPSRSLSPSPEPAQPSRSIIPSLGGAVKVDTPTQDEREDKKETLSEVSKSGSSATKSNRSSRSSSSDTDDHGDDQEYGERHEYHAGEKNKNVKPKKHYSKFDSTPNEDDKSTDEDVGHPNDNDDEVNDGRGTLSGDEEYDEDEEKPVTNPNEIEPLSPDVNEIVEKEPELPVYFPATMGCRHVEEFECLNKIEEGTYGVVYRAKEKRTDDVVALKRLKMEKEKEGFPITSLREINMLLKAGSHQNIVNVREIVVGSNMDKIYLVMDYVEHDLKSLMETMKQGFLVGEVKTLMQQLLAGVHHLHDNWILHRDLKTSNLLLSHQGILKIGDFGLAREYGSPLKPYTPIVVTLWYRAPELLLGIKEYSTPIDIWSVGCIFAELLTLKPLFTGKSEIEQLNKIFKLLGTPNAKIWQGYDDLPGPKKVQFCEYPYNSLRKHFGATLSDKGFSLMNKLLTYDPVKRISAKTAFADEWFKEEPRPVSSDMFPTWPAKSELSKPAGRKSSPKAPSGGKQYKQSDSDELMMRMKQGQTTAASGFNLKFDAPKFK